MLFDDSRIHFPFSKFLTDEFDNPNTRDLIGQSLRIFERFLTANQIELAVRSLDGTCLTYSEVKSLLALCYRPLGEVELLSSQKIRLIAQAKKSNGPAKMPKAVTYNTALKRLNHIASYLKFFMDVFLVPHLRSSGLRTELAQSYEKTRGWLNGAIGGTKQTHHLMIQSLPSDRFIAIIRNLVIEPETLFLKASGGVSSTLYRDRAMALLGCEGLRPGTILNVAREDCRLESGYLVIKDNRDRRLGRPTSGTPVLKMGASSKVNHASEGMIKLWPITVMALSDYIEYEREPALGRRLRNHSQGFLFLNQRTGAAIGRRGSISTMFNRLGERLRACGLLDVGSDAYFAGKKQYDFYGYVLRHSAANFFLEQYGTREDVLDRMRLRFGWTRASKMPQLYAARAQSDRANIVLQRFHQSLVQEARERRGQS